MTLPINNTWAGAGMNQVPASQATVTAQSQGMVLAMVTNYLAAGWTCLGSSDGATTGALDAVNRWSAYTNLVWAAAGTNHSWIVLQSPAGYPTASHLLQLLIACSPSTGTNVHMINMSVTTNGYTGGSLTADPTAVTGLDTKSYVNLQLSPSATVVSASRYHAVYDNVGNTFFSISVNGSGYPAFNCWTNKTSGFESGYLYPVIHFAAYNGAGTGSNTLGFMVRTSGLAAWTNAGVIDTGTTGMTVPYNATNGLNLMGSFTSTGSGFSGQWPGFPAAVFSSNALFFGTLTDMYLAPNHSSITQGAEEPSGTTQMAIFGDLWIPDLGVAPLF